MVNQQGVVPVIIIRGHGRKIPPPQRPHRTKPPVLMVEKPGIRLTIDEGKFELFPIFRPLDPTAPGKSQPRKSCKISRFRPRRPGRQFGRQRRILRNIISRPPPRRQIVGRHQFRIGQRHRHPAHRQMLRQAPRRRHLLPRPEPPRQHPFRHHLPDALLQRPPRRRWQNKGLSRDQHPANPFNFHKISRPFAPLQILRGGLQLCLRAKLPGGREAPQPRPGSVEHLDQRPVHRIGDVVDIIRRGDQRRAEAQRVVQPVQASGWSCR